MRLDGVINVSKSRYFGRNFGKASDYKYHAYIGVGGNLGNVKKRFDNLIRAFKNDKRLWVEKTSPIIKNKAFGYTNQPDFLNAVISLQTSMSSNMLLKIMQHYEVKFKRQRSFKNAPRTLDLDILYYSKKVRKSARLMVPHVGVSDRSSVIVPLGMMIK
ncbi:2-amino-4-hydroxy-6-hydroxymethyldihydropteridine diphosphokinase [Campylobacter majalis]|uniref:2-amino-4-hydroxy-6- hydroxymethyldihydropteridine diphosphokinase n=1 Tax=Campylobacter majalis TaxID=2790656 RepID=UPI003D696BAF